MSASSLSLGQVREHPPEPVFRRLDPRALSDHIETLNQVARYLCRSRDDADDLVQDTLVRVLGRPRWLRSISDRGYLLRALRNAHIDGLRAAARRLATVPLDDSESMAASTGGVRASELVAAIAAAPQPYRDVVVAVDVVGLSYREAACRLRTREATITSRLYRGRQHVARALDDLGPSSQAGGVRRTHRNTIAHRSVDL